MGHAIHARGALAVRLGHQSFNRDTGQPPVQLLGIEKGVRRARFRTPLIRVEWDEEPFEWTYPYSFGIDRRYRSGPLIEMRVEAFAV